jgi:hypothetical protein
MKMKKIIYIAGATLFILTSCQKKVTEFQQPDTITSQLVFDSPTRMEAAVVGTYDALQSANFLSGRALVYADLMGEDAIDKNLFFTPLPKFDMLSNNGLPAGVWTAAYASIARANLVAQGINANLDKIDASKANELLAECKFVRAVSHFYLVNYFAQPYGFTADASHPGVPIILQAFTSNDPAANQPRSTVKEVYDQVIQDLTDALADLPMDYSDTYSTKTRATKAAAAAMLSRVYLYKGDYANAKTFAGNIISGQYGTFALNPNPGDCFGPNHYETDETIWSIPNNVSDNPNTNNALPMHYSELGRGDIAVSPTFMNIATNPYFTSDDKRRGLIVPATLPSNAGYFYTAKYPDVATRSDWAPIIRYPEILLTYAEASARLAAGVDADALAKLNLVRDRSIVSAPSYVAGDFATKNDLINAILGERRIELAFEGHRIFDLHRLGLGVTHRLDGDFSPLPDEAYGADKSIFPIPQNEVDESKGVLTQNPGY